MHKLKLHGFNNLTKSLSFCIYDICYAKTADDRDGYIAYIDEQYNANRLTEILSETCSIIGANILNIARQDYEPQGADIEVSTCGVISPLKALNYLIHQLESDIVTMDYRVRGFTRDVNGVKHYIDHEINSIQNFMSEDIKALYHMMDVNVYQENIFHTKMLLKDFDLKHYLFNAEPEALSAAERKQITDLLWKEMQEIYYGRNIPHL